MTEHAILSPDVGDVVWITSTHDHAQRCKPARVRKVTNTQIIVTTPTVPEARFWRKNGREVGNQLGNILRLTPPGRDIFPYVRYRAERSGRWGDALAIYDRARQAL